MKFSWTLYDFFMRASIVLLTAGLMAYSGLLARNTTRTTMFVYGSLASWLQTAKPRLWSWGTGSSRRIRLACQSFIFSARTLLNDFDLFFSLSLARLIVWRGRHRKS